MLIAQITDTHIRPEGELLCGLVDTTPFLERCVARVAALRPVPDVVLVTGDLADAGLPEEYARLHRILRGLPCPVYVIPGNHDHRETLRTAFGGEGYLPDQGYLQYVVEDFPLRLVGLDSLDPGRVGGALCAERLAWFDACLANAPERPTLVFVHHPPFPTGIAWLDRDALVGATEFAAIIRRHPQVERLLCGHIHRPVQMRWAGTLASTAPATAHQIPLDLTTPGRSAFVMEPSAYQLHLWQPGVGLVSHVSYCGAHSGPHSFRSPPRPARG